MSATKNYSRIVEFQVDEDDRKVKQLWSYGDAQEDRIYACYQGGALRLPQTGNSFMTYGGICTKEGVPSDDNSNFGRSRLIELTPEKEIVFEIWIDSSREVPPLPLSSFRAEHVVIK